MVVQGVATNIRHRAAELCGTLRLILRINFLIRDTGRWQVVQFNHVRGMTANTRVLKSFSTCLTTSEPDTLPTAAIQNMQLLWQAIAAYVFEHNIQMMSGCASMPGADPSKGDVPAAVENVR